VEGTERLGDSSNPENFVVGDKQLQEDSPLMYHESAKIPKLDQDLLKKPRYSIHNTTEIP